MPKSPELAKITICVPTGCKKTDLSVDALDKNARDLAGKTHVYVGDRLLLCRSLKVKEKDRKQVVLLEVMEDCFEIVEADQR